MYIDTMDKFYQFLDMADARHLKVTNPKNLPVNIFPKPEYVYIRALLEGRFSPRKFSIAEVKGLIEELYMDKTDNIPQWYKDKYFKKKEK